LKKRKTQDKAAAEKRVADAAARKVNIFPFTLQGIKTKTANNGGGIVYFKDISDEKLLPHFVASQGQCC
jgi:hypothetical protein